MPSPQLQNIGLALQGLGSGLSGQLPQFLQAQNQRVGLEQQAQQLQMQQIEQQQKMAIERQKTMFTDAFAASQLLDTGNLDGVVQLGINRLQMLKQLSQQDPSIDPSDTQRVTQLAIAARNGDEEALELLKGELSNTVQVGQAIGVLQAPEVSTKVVGGFLVNDKTGEIVFDSTKGQQNLQRVSPGESLYDPATNQVVFQAPARETRDTARESRVENISSQLQAQMGMTPEQAMVEAANIADGNIKYEPLESGQVRRIDMVRGTVSEVPIQPSGQAIPEPQRGRTLYELATLSTGPVSGARAALATVGITNDPQVIEARTELRNSMQELSKALVVNDRFPVAEVERVRKDVDLDPGIIDNPNAMQARMRGLESYLSRRQAQAERDANDPSLPQTVRDGQASNASAIRNFRAVMGVPATITADFLGSAEAVRSVDRDSLRYFIENADDDELNSIPDAAFQEIITYIGGNR